MGKHEYKPSMTRIICLANSWKRGDRCIAGINPNTGQWIRPVSDLPDGRVPKEMRQISRLEPALLDILEIPLAHTGPDFGFECENLSILPGEWRRLKRASASDLLKFCSQEKYILHNEQRYVTIDFMQSLPFSQRYTLQLILAVKLSVRSLGARFEDSKKWEATLETAQHQKLTATITDPAFVRILELGYRPQHPCLVTVSLSMPWRPSDWEKEGDPCWKLIAAVIELRDLPIKNDQEEEELPF